MIGLLPFFWNALYLKLDQHPNTLDRMDTPLQRQSRMTLTFPPVALLIARMERAHGRCMLASIPPPGQAAMSRPCHPSRSSATPVHGAVAPAFSRQRQTALMSQRLL